MIKLIFWVFVLVLALSFFGISIQAIVDSPAGHANVAYLSHLIAQVWSFIVQAWSWIVVNVAHK